MRRRFLVWAGLILALEAAWARPTSAADGAASASAAPANPAPANVTSGRKLLPFRKQEPKAHDLPLEALPEAHRRLARQVLDKPAFAALGPSETFYCKPDQYRWFLDHPDRAVAAWRRLGAKCTSITPKGEQQFGWTDDLGSEVTWEAIHRGGDLRIWYAEGKVKPSAVMPMVPIKALVVMRHKETKNDDGAALITHHAELYVQTDSKTAGMVARMLGPASQRVAEQGLGQLQLFFSGLSWYLDRHPEHEHLLLRETD